MKDYEFYNKTYWEFEEYKRLFEYKRVHSIQSGNYNFAESHKKMFTLASNYQYDLLFEGIKRGFNVYDKLTNHCSFETIDGKCDTGVRRDI